MDLRAARAPVRLEIVAHAPTEFFHCLHCEIVWRASGWGGKVHAEQRQASLPADLALLYAAIGARVQDLTGRYGDLLQVRLIDVLSIEGFYKSVRHRLSTFPAYIVDGRSARGDIERVCADIEQRLAGKSTSASRGA